jgi:hypothetical protein
MTWLMQLSGMQTPVEATKVSFLAVVPRPVVLDEKTNSGTLCCDSTVSPGVRS